MKECPACRRCFPDHVNHCPDDGDATTFSISGEPVLDGRYQLERRIGHGGMGVVFQARHIFLKSAHAIKVILPDLVGNDPMLATRFRQEAIAAAAVHHQNIIAVTDFGVARGTMPFLVMEFIKGRSLHALLAEERVLSPERALEIMSPTCAGVAAAHRHNIVHRDLKPLNIMLQSGMSVGEGLKILDFGLAKIKSGELLGSFVQAKTSGLMGSPFYMAPEQWGDEEPDARADIYSLGVLLYQMLGGDVPFKGPSLPSIMNKHLTQEPPKLLSFGVYIPPAIEEVVRGALEKKPANRPQSVEEFIVRLRDATTRSAVIRQHAQDSQPGYRTAEETLPDISFRRPETLGDATTASPLPGEQHGLGLEETRQGLDEQVERLARELAEAQARAEEARLRVEEAARRRAEEEAARRRAEEEATRKLAEEEAARLRAEEEARLRAEEEAAQERAEEEAARQRELEAARKRAEEDEARRRAEEEANRLALEVEEIKLRAEEARQHAEEEASRRAEEETARKLAEAKAEELELKFAEAQRRAEEARARAEEEARLNLEKEAARRRAEEEAARERDEEAERKRAGEEAARRRAEEEADRLAREIAEAQRNVEEARLRAEEESRRRAEEEAARRRAEEEASRLTREVEEAKRLAEEVRRLAEEEARRKAEEEARRRAEEEAARQREAEAARKRDGEEEARRRAEEERLRAAAVPEPTRALGPVEPEYGEATVDFKLDQTGGHRASEQPAEAVQTFHTTPRLDQGVTQQFQTQESLRGNQTRGDAGRGWDTSVAPGFETHSSGARRQKKGLSRIIPIAAILFLVAGVGSYALYRAMRRTEPAPAIAGSPAPTQTGSAAATQSGMIFIAGGTFKMGADVVKGTDDATKQWPAHEVAVNSFYIGATEVTNAEYAEFVRATGHEPPEGWREKSPPPEQQRWPVTNVSLDDAEAYAAWRSQRDHVKYRLPAEEEWEYAARGGARAYSFPWGNDWFEDRANLGTGAGKKVDFPKPVASYPRGATPDGALDMIGNVWEWTSSRASYYPGNKAQLAPGDEETIVIRGGSHQSLYGKAVENRGGREFPATFRVWVKRDAKDDTLGFRLARDGSGQ
ncbi:MAG TPA: bifunctional serine/threonine-protein kinase/formylglycine-generating enzyme family protein [Pyrinomonadaceae bacterium]|jgi:formylglycine-generating enzyme required for sulfatase activity